MDYRVYETSSGYKFWDAYELQKGYWWYVSWEAFNDKVSYSWNDFRTFAGIVGFMIGGDKISDLVQELKQTLQRTQWKLRLS
ncbi:hypothetical protein N5V81_13450 [Escherichia coli]|nr:hypothetical protein [Escherichia coli]